jgi:predicted enzyme related to lactoylglutathione lyase
MLNMADQASPTIGNGKICYLEIPAVSIEQSAEFYKNVFGWSIRKRGDGATAFDDGVGEVSGAWHTDRKPNEGPGILIYIMVDDINDAISKIKDHHGTIVQEVGADAPEITARFKDPAGNVFGLYQER